MFDASSSQAPITVTQAEVKSVFSAMMKIQHYESFIDDQKVGELTGYTSHSSWALAPGAHSLYVRAYARDSVSVTRVYGFSQTFSVDLSAGEHRAFTRGVISGPPLRKAAHFEFAADHVLARGCADRPVPATHALHPHHGYGAGQHRLLLVWILIEAGIVDLSSGTIISTPVS